MVLKQIYYIEKLEVWHRTVEHEKLNNLQFLQDTW